MTTRTASPSYAASRTVRRHKSFSAAATLCATSFAASARGGIAVLLRKKSISPPPCPSASAVPVRIASASAAASAARHAIFRFIVCLPSIRFISFSIPSTRAENESGTRPNASFHLGSFIVPPPCALASFPAPRATSPRRAESAAPARSRHRTYPARTSSPAAAGISPAARR